MERKRERREGNLKERDGTGGDEMGGLRKGNEEKRKRRKQEMKYKEERGRY